MNFFTVEHQRREQWLAGGWNLNDDDVPTWPEPSPISSAQHRRWWHSEHATQASRPKR